MATDRKERHMMHWFIIPVYRPDIGVLSKLVENLKGHPVLLVNNDLYAPIDIQGQNVTVIENGENHGFGGGANIGLHIAYANGATWMTVINQDLTLSKKTVSAMDTALARVNLGIVGPFGGSFDGKRWTTIVDESKGGFLKNPGYISGSCMSVHHDVITKIGYFHEPFFMYYEDADYCVRAHKAGFKIVSLPRAGITHHHTAVVGVGSDTHQYYLARNHMLFVERCAPIGVKFYEFVRLPKTIMEHIQKMEHGGVKGIRDYILRKFGVYRK